MITTHPSILFIPTNTWTPWGGSERLWVEAAGHLITDHGFKVGVSIKRWPSVPPPLRILLDKATVVERSESIPILQRAMQKIKGPAVLEKRNERLFLEAVERSRPQLAVISQAANMDGLVWMEFCVQHDLPFVTVSQAASPASWAPPEMAIRLASCFSRAVANFFVSDANRILTELQIGVTLQNAHVISNPFNVPYHSQLAYPPVEDDYRLACVARLELHAKGQDVLLEVMADQKWRNRNVKVGLYGDGMDRKHIERLIAMMELSSSVQLHGHQETIEIWKKNHLLVLPSRYEGMPLALIESMLCSRSCVVTDAGGSKELVQDNITGFIALAPSAVSLDEAMERAWNNRDSWKLYGEKAKTHAMAKIPESPSRSFADALHQIHQSRN